MNALWKGTRFQEAENGVLIVGESDYDTSVSLEDAIEAWIEKRQGDYAFSRIFNAFSGSNTERASREDRQAYWDSIAYCNYVEEILPTRSDRPTPAQYEASKGPLRAILKDLITKGLKGVIILGKGQAGYSKPVVEDCGIPCVVVSHPAGRGVKTDALKKGWRDLRDKMQRVSR